MPEIKATGTPGTSPVIRVRHLKENVAALDCFEPQAQEAIRCHVADTIRLVERSASSAWLPIEVDVEIGEAVGEVRGEEGVYEWSRRALQRSMGGPLLHGIVRGALGMFGPDPKGLLKLVPRSIANVYRNCGSWSSTEVSAKVVDLHWHDVPAAFKASEMSQVGFAGAFVAVLDVVKATGEASCAATPDGVDFHIRWR
jgi:hypothetical protein